MNIKTIFPNATTGQNIEGSCYVYDTYGKKMGFVDLETEIFWLKEDYQYWEKALRRLLDHDVKVMKWDKESAKAEQAP